MCNFSFQWVILSAHYSRKYLYKTKRIHVFFVGRTYIFQNLLVLGLQARRERLQNKKKVSLWWVRMPLDPFPHFHSWLVRLWIHSYSLGYLDWHISLVTQLGYHPILPNKNNPFNLFAAYSKISNFQHLGASRYQSFVFSSLRKNHFTSLPPIHPP